MKIGLIDVDRSNFPNLALMKISAYHKSKGDSVEWANHLFGKYDLIYKSKVFTFTNDNLDCYDCEVIKGGTGYGIYEDLPNEIDSIQPDYSIYGVEGVSYGFLTRGCPNKCAWCIVPKKEGKARPYMDVEDVAMNNKHLVLMDNNILSTEYGISQIEKIINNGFVVDFNQGIDARLITDDVAKLLAKVKWEKYIRLACDKSSQLDSINNAYSLLVKNGYKKDIFVYCLLNDFEESYYRVSKLRENKKIKPFLQPYRDFTNNNYIIPQWQKDMAHWANKKSIYYTCEFKNFSPRKGFKCSSYFTKEGGVE